MFLIHRNTNYPCFFINSCVIQHAKSLSKKLLKLALRFGFDGFVIELGPLWGIGYDNLFTMIDKVPLCAICRFVVRHY